MEKRSKSGQDEAAACIPVFPGVLIPPPPCSPLCTPDTHMHTHMAGAAQAARGGRRAANPPAGLPGDDSGQPCLSQRRDRLLKADGGLRNCYSIFTHLFLCISNKQRQLTFRATLGSRKMVISIKYLFPGEEAGCYPLPLLSPESLTSGPWAKPAHRGTC